MPFPDTITLTAEFPTAALRALIDHNEKKGERMIRQEFESEKEVIFEYDGSVSLPVTMTAAEFAEFMPLAMFVYHKNMPQLGYGVPMGPAAALKPAGKKRGRPATKSATAKRGRPRKA